MSAVKYAQDSKLKYYYYAADNGWTFAQMQAAE